MIARLLIANRGEIAGRIARTCRRMGIEYVTVHSEADAGASYREGAVSSVCVGPTAASESYLSIERLLDAARKTGCDAVHPGYGFLSENAAFAAAVVDAGMVFVGPDAQTIAAMGDKGRAKALMSEAGVPVIPGSTEASDDPSRVVKMAKSVGLPALLKPAAGGGGKGMQVVTAWDGLSAAAESAIRLARSSFADGRLLVERLVQDPRHIEVQIFGDSHGNVVHVFERECSLQRRHQKIVEEAPAANLDQRIREQLLSAAVRGARAIGYRNAGTFEFIVGVDGSFYFLEVNTRLQVEHPVTEEITGIDLVEWQLRVADGEPIPLKQHEIVASGHAVECRVYAEDPSKNFQPTPGRVRRVIWPAHLRIETALRDGEDVSPHYDPMVAKLIARAPDRRQAMQAMRSGLQHTGLLGLTTNVGFLDRLLADRGVVEGQVSTRYIDANLDRFLDDSGYGSKAIACVAALWSVGRARTVTGTAGCSPWESTTPTGILDRARLDPGAPFGRIALRQGEHWASARLLAIGRASARIAVGEEDGLICDVTIEARDGVWGGTVDAMPWSALEVPGAVELVIAGQRVRLETNLDESVPSDGERVATAPMAGSVALINVGPGDRVERGAVLAVVEAMKMENPVVAQCDGIVEQVMVDVGDSVSGGQALVLLEVR
ncbi:MAG: carbamoyl-phosphate synthase subunit L [Burkholderiaceae bacterium]|nr:carbamoyl-phosphate synthase subunit L [Burkholderiaceae bacterium]